MAFVPKVTNPPSQTIVYDLRPGTVSLVLAVDLASNSMWIRPLDGGQARTTDISDHWSEIVIHTNSVTEAWFLAGPPGLQTAWSRPYFTQAGANAAVDASTILMLHVLPDASTTFAIMV
jgi:hypothetical protein